MASPDRGVVRLVAHEARTGVSRECSAALVPESKGMRVDAVAAREAFRSVASRTVSFGVTRDARVEISHRLPRVMCRSARSGGEFVRRRMKSPAGQSIALGRVARDADATMTISAKRLQLMTTHATRIVLTSALRMHRHPVVRMHLARTYTSVVTIRALVLRVALGAERAVVRSHGLVTLDEVRRVRRVVHPLRRHQFARGEARDHAPVRLRRVTHDALALRLSLRRAAHVVTPEAPRHTR